VEPIWATLLAKALEGKDVKELLSNVSSGGGAPAGGAAAAIGGAPAEAATEAKEEKKEEEKEESDDDMVRSSCFYVVYLPVRCVCHHRTPFLNAPFADTDCSFRALVCSTNLWRDVLGPCFCSISPSAFHIRYLVVCPRIPHTNQVDNAHILVAYIHTSYLVGHNV